MPLEWSNQFDFVQQRTLFSALRSFEWIGSIAEIFRVTKPGGSIQLLEAAPTDPKGPGLAATEKAWVGLNQLFKITGLRRDCVSLILMLLREVGFENIRVYDRVLPVGKKAGEIGVLGTSAWLGAFKGATEVVMKLGGLGIVKSKEEWLALIDEVSKEWDEVEGVHYIVNIICATKPR